MGIHLWGYQGAHRRVEGKEDGAALTTPRCLCMCPWVATLVGTTPLPWPWAARRWQHGLRRKSPALTSVALEQVGFQAPKKYSPALSN